MTIRPEAAADYAAIADLHARAFGHRTGEALVVALLRHRGSFDPELSLVAEMDGRVVGHVLFSPRVRWTTISPRYKKSAGRRGALRGPWPSTWANGA
ncbi:MAG TPA: hypothetical protein VIJ28_11575 [Chloroflexota bacterium]